METNKKISSRDVDLILFANSSCRQLKKISTDGTGPALIVEIVVNISIAFHLDISLKKISERCRFKKISISKKKLMRKEISFLLKISQILL